MTTPSLSCNEMQGERIRTEGRKWEKDRMEKVHVQYRKIGNSLDVQCTKV